MEYAFDYVLAPSWTFSVASTAMRTMYLLPSTSQRVSKVAVGDMGGVLSVKSIKGNVVSEVFQKQAGKRVSRVYGVKDKIFVACGREVKGFSKKGKNFYTIQTFLSEDILSLLVFGETETMHVAGEHLYCSYVKNTELPFYNSEERITDLLIMSLPDQMGGKPNPQNKTIILACADGCLRFIEGQQAVHHIALEHSPTVLTEYQPDQGKSGLLYGSRDGTIAFLTLSMQHHQVLWEINNNDGWAGINCMTVCDLTGNSTGKADLVVGRDDGTLQAFAVTEADGIPLLKGQVELDSAITSVAVGVVSDPSTLDIVAATFKGVVTGFSTQAAFRTTTEDVTNTLKQRIQALEQDIDSLSSRKPKSIPDPASNLQSFDVKDSFLLTEDASHTLMLETSVPIEMIIVKCDVDVGLTSTSDSLSHSACETLDGGGVIATYRCMPGQSRFQLKVQTKEGSYGLLETYIVPLAAAPKICIRRQHRICALSWHQRTSLPFDSERPLNTLTLNGAFGLSHIHQWVALCLPGVERLRIEAEDVVDVNLVFFSPFVGTQIECCYRAGTATFRSDNLSSISILRDRIMQEATIRNIQIKMKSDESKGSIAHTLHSIAPRFEFYHSLMKKSEMLGALRELTSNNRSGDDILSSAQRLILDDAENIERLATDQPLHFDHMCDKVEKLYLDKFKSMGMDVKNKVPQLRQQLEDYTGIESIIEFFNE